MLITLEKCPNWLIFKRYIWLVISKLMRIRSQLITLMQIRIRILPFNLMRIRIHNTAYKNRYCYSLHVHLMFADLLHFLFCLKILTETLRLPVLFTGDLLRGHGNEADFLGFLQKLVPHRSLTLPFEPFRFWLRIRGDIRNRKMTLRLGESGSRLVNV